MRRYYWVAGRPGWVQTGVDAAEYERQHPQAIRIPKPRKPTRKQMDAWLGAGVASAMDGCRVEPDGTCPHGCPSMMVYYGALQPARVGTITEGGS